MTGPARRPLATTEEVAEYLRVPVETVKRWRKRGLGPEGVRVGRHVRYSWPAVDAWLKQRAS